MNESTLVPREEISDLDWLARNVHVWPYEHQAYCYVVTAAGGKKVFSASAFSPFFSKFTKDQWLARRAELQNKPSWNKAEKWAEWLAQDEDGEWKWLAGLPGKYVDGWTAVKIKGCCKGLVLGNWWDTLEKRPEHKAFKPLTSIEDNQEKDMKQDNGWFERGELPPVGVVCEYTGSLEGSEFAPPAGTHVTVVAHHRFDHSAGSVAVFAWFFHEENCGVYIGPSQCFRPIRTEREVLIEMLADIDGSPASAGKVADAILAAGFKRDGGEE